jgi:hypothetical protein
MSNPGIPNENPVEVEGAAGAARAEGVEELLNVAMNLLGQGLAREDILALFGDILQQAAEEVAAEAAAAQSEAPDNDETEIDSEAEVISYNNEAEIDSDGEDPSSILLPNSVEQSSQQSGGAVGR